MIQDYLLRFRESIAILKSIINKRWNCVEVITKKLFSFIPKYCTTDNPSNGAIFLQERINTSRPHQISIDGVFVELETERTLSIGQRGDSNRFISSFSFVGKRAGKGKIIFRSSEIEDKASFSIKIIPKTI